MPSSDTIDQKNKCIELAVLGGSLSKSPLSLSILNFALRFLCSKLGHCKVLVNVVRVHLTFMTLSAPNVSVVVGTIVGLATSAIATPVISAPLSSAPEMVRQRDPIGSGAIAQRYSTPAQDDHEEFLEELEEIHTVPLDDDIRTPSGQVQACIAGLMYEYPNSQTQRTPLNHREAWLACELVTSTAHGEAIRSCVFDLMYEFPQIFQERTRIDDEDAALACRGVETQEDSATVVTCMLDQMFISPSIFAGRTRVNEEEAARLCTLVED